MISLDSIVNIKNCVVLSLKYNSILAGLNTYNLFLINKPYYIYNMIIDVFVDQ